MDITFQITNILLFYMIYIFNMSGYIKKIEYLIDILFTMCDSSNVEYLSVAGIFPLLQTTVQIFEHTSSELSEIDDPPLSEEVVEPSPDELEEEIPEFTPLPLTRTTQDPCDPSENTTIHRPSPITIDDDDEDFTLLDPIVIVESDEVSVDRSDRVFILIEPSDDIAIDDQLRLLSLNFHVLP